MRQYIIGIGAQKAGTTWLADYFDNHPDIFMSPIKELHFFDSQSKPELSGVFEKLFLERLKNLAKINLLQNDYDHKRSLMLSALADRVNFDNINDYKDYFESKAHADQLCCEITPAYSILDDIGFNSIKSLSNSVKLIFLMRDPVSRFWSAAKMLARDKNLTLSENEIRNLLRNPQFLLRTDYKRTLESAFRVFPIKDIHIEFYENLFNNESIQNLCDFCGVNYIQPNFDRILNKGSDDNIPEEFRIIISRQFRHVYVWAYDNFGKRIPADWQDI